MTRAASRQRAALVSGAVMIASACGIALLWVTLEKPAQRTEVVAATRDVQPAAVATSTQERIAALDTRLAVFDDRSAARPSTTVDSGPYIHPHPITAAHQRLRRERAFIADLNQAIDFRDGPALRASLDAYRRDFPGDEQHLQAGYAIIADCLTAPGDSSRAGAQSFYDEHHGSSLRRWVRRVCLEAEPSAK